MPKPLEIQLHKKSRTLEITFDDGVNAELPSEYLRVYSPSAEVRGHGPGQATLQTGKENVFIDGIQAVGQYAVKLLFSDGHDTGLYTWNYLYELATEYEQKWPEYLEKLKAAGYQRQ